MLMSVELKAPTDRSQSDCVHEQVAKADCECPLYSDLSETMLYIVSDRKPEIPYAVSLHPQSRNISAFPAETPANLLRV